ncbi:diaminopimelate epimerase [Streptomyces agglomeratus]|uniref:Diaminopimelate epimerase n=1 Tax=Streptomyces agglomeratus TaxID=285458 RepID=A0A1E5P4E7_9ACTN|nr:diaminopimelate epimerase [Streptomyces agglomeratus]OEJ24413.1 diaminopimelate epimerase [Streptomyces agglomeratus]OEJ54126.1 diaminopimelate epimerase [Streptomyces agglomeratus]OEJ61498.1 diaminopimelate epimerase [Streptomyces agglomeratus]
MSDFTKYQALGNDYLVIDPLRVDFTATAQTVRLLCDRHLGVGADGVLIGPTAEPRPGEPVGLRIFNSDGSPCEKSGNGLRMFALYLAEHYGAGPVRPEEPAETSVVLRTVAGDSRADILDFAEGRVRVEMGVPAFATDAPVGLTAGARHLDVIGLHLGNPHTVVPLDEVSADLARELGPLIAWHPAYPEGTNVQFLSVLDRGTIRIEVWERGAGYTLASGSSACAATAAAHRLGLVGEHVVVEMAGGTMEVSVGEQGEITMTGTAEQVATGDFSPAFRARLGQGVPA